MEKKIRICLMLSLAGLLLLFVLSSLLSPNPTKISNLNKDMMGEKVAILANITSLRSYNNETFHILTVADETGNITAVVSSEENIKEKIIGNHTYFILGTLQEYNNTLQISAEKIEKK